MSKMKWRSILKTQTAHESAEKRGKSALHMLNGPLHG